MPRSIRDIAIVLFFVGAGLLILLSSARKPESGPVNRILYTVVRPFQEALYGVQSRISHTWQGYIALVKVQDENRALKEENRRLRGINAGLVNQESENHRLRKLLNLKAQHEFPALVAQVIGEDAVGWYRTFFINRGADEGIRPDMPVTAADGLVGRIVRSSGEMSQVLLITDPNLSVDCRVERTRDRGVLTGALEGGCILRYVRLNSAIRPGDKLVTSGLDGIFPRGLPVGTAESLRKGDQGLFLEARVRPEVDFLNLEEVLVVLGQQGGFDIQPNLERKP
jgi:rod shape-determining protein MreC